MNIAATAGIVLIAVCCIGPARAADSPQLTAIPGDQPPRDAPPKLELYTGPRHFGPAERPSSAVERGAALAGNRYTVISPALAGAQENYSFVRFPNGGLTTATFYVTVVGSPTGHNYGTVITYSPAYSSPQYAMADILNTLQVTDFSPGDILYSLYVQSPQADQTVGFQHVVWNRRTGDLENASVCTYKPATDYSLLNRLALNVHTTRLPDYPGIVYLHNYSQSPTTFRGNVFDAIQGDYLGTITQIVEPNASAPLDGAAIQAEIGFNPGPNQFHMNILFELPAIGPYYGIVAYAVNNLRQQSYANMSVACPINP